MRLCACWMVIQIVESNRIGVPLKLSTRKNLTLGREHACITVNMWISMEGTKTKTKTNKKKKTKKNNNNKKGTGFRKTQAYSSFLHFCAHTHTCDMIYIFIYIYIYSDIDVALCFFITRLLPLHLCGWTLPNIRMHVHLSCWMSFLLLSILYILLVCRFFFFSVYAFIWQPLQCTTRLAFPMVLCVSCWQFATGILEKSALCSVNSSVDIICSA